MTNVIEFAKGSFFAVFGAAYIVSMPVGIGFAIARDSWVDALLSLIIPMWGAVYAFVGG